MIVAGVGFRRATSPEEIERVVRLALGRFDVPLAQLDALATEAAKADAAAGAARRLAVPMIACTMLDLVRVAGDVTTPSQRVLAAKGVPSIAEASALVAAGRNARLLGSRVATERATCAIAVGDGQ